MKKEPSEIFKILGVENRIRIIDLLKKHGAMGAKEISARIGITTAAVSQHLKILKQAGLVTSERKGYWIPYSIDEKVMDDCRKVVAEVCKCGCIKGGRSRKTSCCKDDLEILLRYEKELKSELSTVQQRIKEAKKG